MKWFKKQYNKMSTLMRNNSGFGWDPIAKTFTASDEVWKDYLKSHPSHSKLREKSVVDYEDLKIVVGGGTATGNGSIALGADDTDATTYGEENRDFGIEDFSYDPTNDAFIAPNHYQPSYQPPSPRQYSPPSQSPLGSEVPTEKPSRNKRSRSDNIWDVIKEIPNLDDNTRYMACDLLNTKAKKDLFLKMSLEERSSWINFKLG
ncbi:hypothetical protein LguiB_007603 [Lonicera macranthoides]